MGLIFVPWFRRSFLVGEILFNSHILLDLFLIGLSWLGLSVGHKIFPYMLMREGQAMSASSKVRLSSLASLRQLHIPSMYYSRLVQVFVVFKVQPSSFILSLLGRERASEVDEFIRTVAFA